MRGDEATIQRDPDNGRVCAIMRVVVSFNAIGDCVVMVADMWIYMATAIVKGCDRVGAQNRVKRGWAIDTHTVERNANSRSTNIGTLFGSYGFGGEGIGDGGVRVIFNQTLHTVVLIFLRTSGRAAASQPSNVAV